MMLSKRQNRPTILLSRNPKTLLAVFAHPDDEAFTLAGTLAKCAQKKVRTVLVFVTSGQAGSKRHIKKGQDLAKIREKELTRCAKILKIKHLYLLGYQDGKLHRQNPKQIQDKIEEILKIENPHVVITFGEDGVSGHVDHVAVSKATTAAFKKICNSQISRLLYVAPVKRGSQKIKTGLPPHLSATKAKWIVFHSLDAINVLIDIKDVWPEKLAAFKCYFSQDDVRGFYRQIKKKPIYEECFRLAMGPKYKTRPASDLFD